MSEHNDVRIVARGSGQNGDDYLKVSFENGGKRKEAIFAVSDLTCVRSLRLIGILTNASKNAFAAQAELALRSHSSTFDVADQSGWFGYSFVWPDGAVNGDQNLPIRLGPAYRHAEHTHLDGSLKNWLQECSSLARHNSLLMLVISHAFTGPVADFLGIEAPAIQLVGEAGVFKTSLVTCIAHMWGNRIKSWHGTDNGIEELAACHHATHLVLDDFRVDKKHPYEHLRATAIRLLDGRTKDRMGERSRQFCTPILSTSNRSNDEHARLAGLANDADQAAIRGRLTDMPLLGDRRSLFEELHGFATPLDFMEHFSEFAQLNSGRPARHFVTRMRENICRNEEGVRSWLVEQRAFYEAHASRTFESLPGYDLTRVHGRFATIYATGMLANRFGTVRWSYNQLLNAIMTCEAAHLALAAQGGRGDLEGSPFTALRRDINATWQSYVDLRQGLLNPEQHNHLACPGYLNQGADGLEILLPYKQIQRICGSRRDYLVLLSELRHEGLILECEARPSVKRFIYAGRDPKARIHVIAVRADGFEPFASRELSG